MAVIRRLLVYSRWETVVWTHDGAGGKKCGLDAEYEKKK